MQLHFFFIEDSKIENSGPDFGPKIRGLQIWDRGLFGPIFALQK
jgi:hypothetical protein